MRRDVDIRPAAAVVIRRLKAGDDLTGVERVVEFPKPVQRRAQAGFAVGKLFHAGVSHMVGMGRDPVFGKEKGGFESAHVKIHMLLFLSIQKERLTG